MIDISFLSVKLNLVRKYAGDLEKFLENPIERIRKDFVAVYAVERIFQLIVDEIIDINNHIILRNILKRWGNILKNFPVKNRFGLLCIPI